MKKTLEEKILKNFNLSLKKQNLIKEILCEEMNLDRCTEIIDSIIELIANPYYMT